MKIYEMAWRVEGGNDAWIALPVPHEMVIQRLVVSAETEGVTTFGVRLYSANMQTAQPRVRPAALVMPLKSTTNGVIEVFNERFPYSISRSEVSPRIWLHMTGSGLTGIFFRVTIAGEVGTP